MDDLQLPTHPDRRSLWLRTVIFSSAMDNRLKKHAPPLRTHVVKAFAGSTRKLNLHFWLSQ